MAFQWTNCFLFVTICTGLNAFKFADPPSLVAVVGATRVQLHFSWTKDDHESLLLVTIKTYNHTDQMFVEIANFVPSSEEASLSPHGGYLKGQVSLKASKNYFSIIFNEIRCENDSHYKCVVTLFSVTSGPFTKISPIANMTVISKSAKPDLITSDTDLSSIMNLHNVTFTCKGYVGSDRGKFVWKKYQLHNPIPTVYSDVVTAIEAIPENCTCYGSSNLTIQITDRDNQAMVSCVEESYIMDKTMEYVTDPLNVFYQRKEVHIAKTPDLHTYISNPKLDLHMNCTSDGNPVPIIKWYKNTNALETVSVGHVLIIHGLSPNDSASYFCDVYNSFYGKEYVLSKEVHIVVVDSNGISHPNDIPSCKNCVHYQNIVTIATFGVCSALLIIVMALLIFVFYLRKLCCFNKNTKELYETLSSTTANRKNTDMSGTNASEIRHHTNGIVVQETHIYNTIVEDNNDSKTNFNGDKQS